MLAERSVCACVCVSNLLLLAADESDAHIGLFLQAFDYLTLLLGLSMAPFRIIVIHLPEPLQQPLILVLISSITCDLSTCRNHRRRNNHHDCRRQLNLVPPCQHQTNASLKSPAVTRRHAVSAPARILVSIIPARHTRG